MIGGSSVRRDPRDELAGQPAADVRARARMALLAALITEGRGVWRALPGSSPPRTGGEIFRAILQPAMHAPRFGIRKPLLIFQKAPGEVCVRGSPGRSEGTI